MNELLAGWEKLCVSSAGLRFVDINLRGTGQVMLQDNPLSGALFLAAIAWGSFAAGAPRIAIGGILALLVATLTAYWVRADEKSLAAGLYGFNGILVGLALPTFLAPGPLLWAYVILGGAVSAIVMMWTVKAGDAMGRRFDLSICGHDLASASGDLRICRADRAPHYRPARSSGPSSLLPRTLFGLAILCKVCCTASRRCF